MAVASRKHLDFTPEQVALIARLRLANVSIRDIAERLGRSRAHVELLIQAREIPGPKGKPREVEPTAEEVERLVAEQYQRLPPWWERETARMRAGLE